MACTIKFKDGTEMSEAQFYAWAMDNIDLEKFKKTGSIVYIDKKAEEVKFSAIRKLASNIQKSFQLLFGKNVEVITDTKEIDRILAMNPDAIQMEQEAWHGSPYDIDEFKTEKIGTGEGAQAFGWGLYFTDLIDIARNYANKLTKKGLVILDNSVYDNISAVIQNIDYASSEKEFFNILENPDFGNSDKTFEDIINEYHFIKSFNDRAGNKRFENYLSSNNSEYIKELSKTYYDLLESNKSNEEKTKEYNAVVDKYKETLLSDYEKAKNGEVEVVGENKRNLYKVVLHKGKTPEQYNWLEWDKPLTQDVINKIEQQAKSENIKIGNLKYAKSSQVTRVDSDGSARFVYPYLSEILGSDKEASLFLLRAGIDGVKYPAESIARGATSDTARGFNYVVFDENAITIKEKIQFMRNPQGKVLGFVYEGKVYIDPRTASPTTPIHEFGHIWNAYVKENHKAFYKKGISLIKQDGGTYIERVKKNYPHLAEKGREEELYEEALAQAIGDRGQYIAKKDQNKFLSWLKEMWTLVKGSMKLSVSAEALSKMTLNDYTNLVAGSMLKGSEIYALAQAEATSQATSNPKVIKQAVKNLIATKEKITVALSKLMGDLYKAESRGFVNGLKTAEARNRAMKEYQAEARKFLKDRGIPVNLAMERAIYKIKDEVSFAKTLTKLVELDNADIRLEQIDRIKGLVGKLKKLRKNKNKLTSSDRAFINNLELPSPYEVSDLDGYEKVLKGLIGAMDKGQREIGVNPKVQFEDFITQELDYINSYKEMIAEIKKMIQTAQWKDEYAELKESGAFEGTNIKSEEDWIELKEGINSEDAAKAEYFQKKLDELEDKFNEKTKLLSDLKDRTKKLMESNKEALVEAFKEYEDTSTPLDYDQILNNIDNLSYNQLIRLGNIIDNIVAFEDPSGIGDFASLARLNSRLDGFLASLSGRKLLGLKSSKDTDKLSMNQLIAEITYAGDSINKALNFILGNWNSMISKAKMSYDKVFSRYEDLKNDLADRKDKNKNETIFKSTVRIDTFAFINQWFKSDTKEDQDAHIRDRVKALADQHIKFLKEFISPNPNSSDKINIRKAKEGLQALQDFGVIKNLDLSNFSYDLVDDIKQESLMGNLNPKELSLYVFMLDSFRGLENFKNAMTINMDKQYDEVENYFPTFPRRSNESSEQASIEDMKSTFQRMSRSNSRAKGRSRQIANGKYIYNSGLTENFSKGYWEALLIDMGSSDLLDMSNIIYSKFGLQRLAELGLTENSVKIIKQRLNEKAVTDVNYGNINTNIDEAVSLEAERAFNNGVIGMILKNPKQLLKQGVAPFLTNFMIKPKASGEAVKILNNESVYSNALHNLLDKSTIQSRLILYELNPIELGVPAEYVQGRAGKTFSALKTIQSGQEKIGDIVLPLLKSVGAYKTNYNSFLAATDAYISKMNILVGYIDHQMKKGKTIEQILKDLNENKVDPISLQNAERWQADMNAESMRSNVAKILRDNAGGYKYFMKSFPVTTHQAFVQGIRKITSKAINGNYINDEKKDLSDTVKKFIIQQILYRATVDIGISFIAMAIEKGLTGGDDDEYFWNELLAKSSGQFLFDLVLGSKSVYADIGYAVALNLGWKAYAISELEKRKAEDINFKSKALEKGNLVPENQFGGVAGVAVKVVVGLADRVSKGINKEESWTSIIKDLAINFISPMLSVLTGSGTIRQAVNQFESVENKRARISNLIDAELATELGGFSFSIPDDKRTNIMDIAQKWDFNQIKSSLFVEPKTNQLCLIPKETYKQMQEDATFDLFGVRSSYVSSIIGTSNYKKLSSEKIEKFSEKYGLKYNDKRFIIAQYANKALDADAIRDLVNSAVTEIAKKSVESKSSKYTIYKYKIEK
jgi:hypothetical protein